ncbi:MAG: YfhO family protein [Bacilli bacterium]
MLKKYTKFDYLNIFVIIASFFAVCFIILGKGNVFYGSTMDFANQHYMIPEYFRTLFYETKDFIPSFAFNLGMGQNIFNFSYYGLFNPLILISYLLPFVKMSSYLATVSVLVVILDVVLFYYFISKKTEDRRIRFISTFLFAMASPLILHSHRHVMFVNYMPFLILGLIGVENYVYKNEKVLLMLSILFVVTISYFFSIPALIVMFLYGIFLYLKDNKKFVFRDFVCYFLKFAIYFIIPIMIAGVLLLPTFKAILNSRFDSGNTLSFLGLLVPDVNFNYFLYKSYALGLSSILIISILNAVMSRDKPYRFLGIVFLLLLVFPVFNYVLNGFMYLNGKVFIPFIPLAILLFIKLISDIESKKTNFKILIFVFLVISVLGCIKYDFIYVYLFDSLFTLIGIILFKYGKKIPLFVILIIVSFSVCLFVNLKDELVDRKIVDSQYDKEISSIIKSFNDNDNSIYRTVSVTNGLYNSNNIRDIGEYKTTMYSSLTNKYYKDFYWNIFDTENPNRNDAIFSDVSNPLFNVYFGNKYYVSLGDAPVGYTLKSSFLDVKLYENDDVFSIGYASDKLMSLKEFKTLDYPYNVSALLNNIIVDKDVSSDFVSVVKKVDVDIVNPALAKEENGKYVFLLSEDKEYKLKREKFDDKIMIIKFDMEYSNSCNNSDNKGDTSISINGIKNKLTCKGWKYHNKNYSFSYVVSPSEDLDIEISKGKYVISNVNVYEFDYSKVKEIKKYHDEFMIDKKKTSGDYIFGNINVSRDNNYFNLSIPYDEGYNIYVDGEEVSYEKTNTSFIGFPIDKGYHEIKIKYTAPWLNIGKVVSVLGIICFVVVLVSKGVKKNEKNINDNTLL